MVGVDIAMGLLDIFRKKKEEGWPEQMVPASKPPEVQPASPSLERSYLAQPTFSSSSFSARKRARPKRKAKSKPIHFRRKNRKRSTSSTKARPALGSRGGASLTQKSSGSRSRLKSLSRKIIKHTHLKRSVIRNLNQSRRGIYGPKENLLGDALSDLGKELRDLYRSRRKLHQQLAAASSELEKVQSRKVKWQTQIASAAEKETKLMKKKTAAKDKMIALDQKIQKVRSIERELKEV